MTAQRLEGDHGGLWHGLRPQTGSPAKNRMVHMDKREHTLSAGLRCWVSHNTKQINMFDFGC